jgi:hypothetical protein
MPAQAGWCGARAIKWVKPGDVYGCGILALLIAYENGTESAVSPKSFATIIVHSDHEGRARKLAKAGR